MDKSLKQGTKAILYTAQIRGQSNQTMILVQSAAQLSHQIKNTAFYKKLLWDPSELQYSC